MLTVNSARRRADLRRHARTAAMACSWHAHGRGRLEHEAWCGSGRGRRASERSGPPCRSTRPPPARAAARSRLDGHPELESLPLPTPRGTEPAQHSTRHRTWTQRGGSRWVGQGSACAREGLGTTSTLSSLQPSVLCAHARAGCRRAAAPYAPPPGRARVRRGSGGAWGAGRRCWAGATWHLCSAASSRGEVRGGERRAPGSRRRRRRGRRAARTSRGRAAAP